MKLITLLLTAFTLPFLWCKLAISQVAGEDLLLRAYTDCISLEKYAAELQKEFEQGKLTNEQLFKAREKLFAIHFKATQKHFSDMGWDDGMAEQLTIWNSEILINILKKYNGNCEVIRNTDVENSINLIKRD